MATKQQAKRSVAKHEKLSRKPDRFLEQRKGGKAPAVRSPFQDLIDHARVRWLQIPEEERANIPADGSKNLDHYLYGTRPSE